MEIMPKEATYPKRLATLMRETPHRHHPPQTCSMAPFCHYAYSPITLTQYVSTASSGHHPGSSVPCCGVATADEEEENCITCGIGADGNSAELSIISEPSAFSSSEKPESSGIYSSSNTRQDTNTTSATNTNKSLSLSYPELLGNSSRSILIQQDDSTTTIAGDHRRVARSASDFVIYKENK